MSSAAAPLRLGLVGLDSSHAEWFACLANDPRCAERIPGIRVVAAYPGGVAELPISRDRVASYTRLLRDELGVPMLESPEAVADAVDAVLITAVDARTHLALARATLPAGKPVFIDKPLATSVAEAAKILALARQHGAAVFSASSLRYSSILPTFSGRERGTMTLRGPLPFQPAMPGWFWYGIHYVEVAFAVFGHDWSDVDLRVEADAEIATIRFASGASAVLRGRTNPTDWRFRLSLGSSEPESGEQELFGPEGPPYRTLLDRIVAFARSSISPVGDEEMLSALRCIEAINRARQSLGK